MFDKQLALLEELRGVLPDKAVDTFRKLFGDPGASLEHRGAVVLTGQRRSKAGQQSLWKNLFIAKGATARFEGPAEGAIVWCRTVADWTTKTNVKTGLTEYWVQAKDCDTNGLMQGPAFTVRLIMTGGQEPILDSGDMLAYCYAFDGTRISFPCSGETYTASVQPPVTGEMALATQPRVLSSAMPVTAAMPAADAKITVRNLLYHVHPAKANDVWRKNVRQIVRRMELFNGRRLVGVMTGPGLEPIEAVRDAFAPWPVELFPIPNDALTSECASLRALLPLLYSLNPAEATFFAHTKGTWNPRMSPVGIAYWRNALYHALLDDFTAVEEALERHVFAGGCKMVCPKQTFPSGLESGTWHFSGTFWWFRHDRVFGNPQWAAIPNDRYGAEAYPGMLCESHEGATLYQPVTPEGEGKYYHASAHPDRIGDDPEPVRPVINIGTAITSNYLSRAMPFVETLHRACRDHKFCVTLGFDIPGEIERRFPSIRFVRRERDCVESFGMIQHGPWLDACPWINPDDLCIFTDADVLIQRSVSESEAASFERYGPDTIGLGDNCGRDDTLAAEAKRIGLENRAQYLGNWNKIPCYNCGVIVARASLFNRLRKAYDAESQHFHKQTCARSRCQWLICYLVHKMGLTVDRLGGEFHANGHFGAPGGCEYDTTGRLLFEGRIVMFRHVL